MNKILMKKHDINIKFYDLYKHELIDELMTQIGKYASQLYILV